MADEIIAAAPTSLKRGSVNLDDTASTVLAVYEQLRDACAHFAYTGGDGDQIAAAFRATYGPGRDAMLDFLMGIWSTVTSRADAVQATGQVLGTADTGAVTSAGGKRG